MSASGVDKRRIRLIDQRDELLLALDRLDAELAAGQIDEADHESLSDDLIRRTARVIRRLEDVDPSTRTEPARSPRASTLVVLGVVVVAALALGFVVASFAGVRGSGGATGDIALSSRDYLVRAELALEQGRVDDANSNADEALNLAPNDPAALVVKGRAVLLEGDAVAALQLYDRALAVEPTYFNGLVQKALLLLNIPEPDIQQQAIDLLDQAIAQDPVTFEAHMLRASAASNIENDAEAAIGYYRGVLERNPPEVMRGVVEGLIDELEAELGG